MKLAKQLRLLLLGAPGSGKGTQTSRLVKAFPTLNSLSSGDILRAEVARGTPLGLQASKLIEEGKLVPDETMVGVIKNHLLENDWLNGDSLWLLDPSLQRPINIPGCSPVELQRETNIHLISKLQERDNSLLDDDHFFHHDVDAYPSSGYSHRQDNSNDLHVPANPRSWRQSEEPTSVTPLRDFPRDDGLERGFTSQPTPGPFASPMQDSIHTSGLVPDIPDDTSADLERWFLYPI